MGQLRDRMEQDLKLRGFSPATIRNYLLYCRNFAAFFMRSPEDGWRGSATCRSKRPVDHTAGKGGDGSGARDVPAVGQELVEPVGGPHGTKPWKRPG